MINDLKNNVTVQNAYDAATVASDGDTNGNTIDLKGYHSGMFVLRVGTLTDGTYTLGIEESSDGSTWADIDSSRVIGTAVALDAANEHDALGFVTEKRYARMTVTAASTTSGADITGLVVIGSPEQAKVPAHDETA
jgi:hypothetical protein